MPTTCIIFDIDGTLVDSGGFEDSLYADAVREVCGNVRFRADWADYEHVTDAGILLEIGRDNGLEGVNATQEVRARFGELMSAYLRAGGPCAATAGALAFWDKLRDRADIQLGIATGGWGHTARMKLASAGFVCTDIPLASSDDSHVRMGIMERCRGQLSATDSTIYIGDGAWDQAATERLGWHFIGVGHRLRGKCSDWVPDFASVDVLDRMLAQGEPCRHVRSHSLP